MTSTGQDSLGTRSTLRCRRQELRLLFAGQGRRRSSAMSTRLPFSMKVLLENLLRFEDGVTVTATTSRRWSTGRRTRSSTREIQYRPARVLMQDFTGVPAVVDLAAMRDAMAKLGGDPQKINPLVPVHLVIDHSVMVDEFGTPARVREECRARISAQHASATSSSNGAARRSTISGGAAGHRHLPPGQSRIYRARRLDRRRTQRRRRGRLSRHSGRHRQPHDDGQRPRRARLGRRRDRGRGGDARPAGVDADPRSRRLPPDRRAQGRHHRHRPRADRHPDASRRRASSAASSNSTAPASRRCRSPTARRSPTWRPNMARPAASSRSTTRRSTICA